MGSILGALGRVAHPMLKSIDRHALKRGDRKLSHVIQDVVEDGVSSQRSLKRRAGDLLSESVPTAERAIQPTLLKRKRKTKRKRL